MGSRRSPFLMVEAYLNLSHMVSCSSGWSACCSILSKASPGLFGGEDRRQMCHTYSLVCFHHCTQLLPARDSPRLASTFTCCPLCWWRADLHRGLTVSRPFFSRRKGRCDVALARRAASSVERTVLPLEEDGRQPAANLASAAQSRAFACPFGYPM